MKQIASLTIGRNIKITHTQTLEVLVEEIYKRHTDPFIKGTNFSVSIYKRTVH